MQIKGLHLNEGEPINTLKSQQGEMDELDCHATERTRCCYPLKTIDPGGGSGGVICLVIEISRLAGQLGDNRGGLLVCRGEGLK